MGKLLAAGPTARSGSRLASLGGRHGPELGEGDAGKDYLRRSGGSAATMDAPSRSPDASPPPPQADRQSDTDRDKQVEAEWGADQWQARKNGELLKF